MIEIESYPEERQLEVYVHERITPEDVRQIEAAADAIIANHGRVDGVLIDMSDFHGWDSWDALKQHFQFVRNHHHDIDRIAAVSNHDWHKWFPKLASPFVDAEPRYFELHQINRARNWLREAFPKVPHEDEDFDPHP